MEDTKNTQEAAPSRGPRGELGTATASKTIKKLWHASTTGKHLSLKEFARKLAADGDQIAKDWIAHKHGSLNQKRSEKNVARVALERSATMASRKKTKK